MGPAQRAPLILLGSVMRPMRTALVGTALVGTALVVAALVGGCIPCEPSPPTSLVSPEAWQLVDEGDDPFEPRDDSATITRCDASAVMTEDYEGQETWTVDTSTCNWVTVEQPLLQALSAGDEVRVELFWFSQVSFIGGPAEVKLAIDGDTVLSELVDIPTEFSLLDRTITMEADAAQGAPVHFHIGNHGANTWNLLDVTRPASDDCAPTAN